MKTLTLTQPWATLVAIGAKELETRSWRTFYKGPIAIHAAKGFPKWAKDIARTDPVFREVLLEAGYVGVGDLPLGEVVATANLVACERTEHITAGLLDGLIGKNELHFGDYSPGRWAWLLGYVRRLDNPIPVKGALGLWEWTPDQEVPA